MNKSRFPVLRVVASVESRLSKVAHVNPKDYGAKGDGITDDTESIQAAIHDNPGSVIKYPNGTYKISSALSYKAQ